MSGALPCGVCGNANPDGARFCRVCGAPVAPAPGTCPACGEDNRPGARFCRRCGQTLTAEPTGLYAPLQAERTHGPARPVPAASPILLVSAVLLAAIVLGLGAWLLFLRQPPGVEVTEYATQEAPIWTSSDPAASTVIGRFQRGDTVTGAWTLGPDGKTRWLKVKWGSAKGYVPALVLSDRARPPLATANAGSRTALAAGMVYPEPDGATTVVDSVAPGDGLAIRGVTPDGWVEVGLKSGAVGYVKTDVFQAPPPPPPAPDQSAQPPPAPVANAAPSPTAPLQGTFTYACAYAPDQSINGPPTLPGMSFTVDEGRACVNNRSAYRREADGGLSRMMLLDAERRASLLYFTPDRRTFARQDVMLPPAAYAQLRANRDALVRIACPAPGDQAGAAQIADLLGRETPVLNPQNLPPGSGWRRMVWHCAPLS